MSQSTFSGPVRSKNGFEIGSSGLVAVGEAESSDNDQQLSITSEQVVEASASTPDTRIKISVNGVEYYLPLEAV